MAELRELSKSCGYAEVQSYIQSGNLIFKSTSADTAEAIEPALEKPSPKVWFLCRCTCPQCAKLAGAAAGESLSAKRRRRRTWS